jgi:hypothetical protein
VSGDTTDTGDATSRLREHFIFTETTEQDLPHREPPASRTEILVKGTASELVEPGQRTIRNSSLPVNQGDVLLVGAGPGTWVRVAVNFLVPFCVASIGLLSARRARGGDPPRLPAPRDDAIRARVVRSRA